MVLFIKLTNDNKGLCVLFFLFHGLLIASGVNGHYDS